MPFTIGQCLGRFEILGPLGAGGMGEVYRARDPQLQREVAIKVLPSQLSQDAVSRRRFEQEARAAGGLNHPNILAVHDVGVEADVLYIVTELLEGETLATRLAGQALTPAKAAAYAIQIASGLAAAHDRGVVHRDIKPSNLFVTTDGRIKILDFGLAKFLGGDGPSITESITVEGVPQTPLIGSVAYMAPEQVRGHRVDHRTDIFSFGGVLYEMLSGFPPFRRGTSGEMLNAILHEEPPPLSAHDAGLAPLERVVRHCLEKAPDDRFQNIRDLIFDLEGRRVEPGRAGARSGWITPAWIAAGLLAAGAIGGFATARFSTRPPAAVHRVRTLTNLVGLEEFPAISPDGKMVAFTVVEGARRQIYIRYLADGAMQPVTTDDADHEGPRWLPDGSSLMYFSPARNRDVQGGLYRIPALGGSAQRIIASVGAGDVSGDGRLACFRLENGRMQLVTTALDGTSVTRIADLPTQHYGYPRWSPDRRWIAFQAGDGFRWDLQVVAAAASSTPRQITHDAKVIKGLSWLPDSSGVLYASARGSTFAYLPPMALWEARLDGRQRQVTTAEVSYEQPDLYASGVASATRMQMRYDIWEYPFDAAAAPVESGRQLTRQTGQVATPTPSPDGSSLAYLSDSGDHANVWIAPSTGLPRQITFEHDREVAIGVPAWSPDGSWIAYLSSKGNGGLVFGVWLVRPDASENHQILPRGLSPTWSADGKWIYYVETSNTSIKRVAVAGGAPETVRSEPARNVIGVHDTTVYYVVDRALTDGRQQFEIHAAGFGDARPRILVTIPDTRVPAWQVINPSLSPDGKWLALPLTDGFTTNIWTISTADGRMQQVTNFGVRPTFIPRRVAWSADGRSLLAAVGEGDADIVLFDGLIAGGSR